MTLGGAVCIRNGDSLDYSWREAVRSLLPICDKVVICDSDSTDGTGEALREWAHLDERIVPVNFPWTDPAGDGSWYPGWISYARQHLDTDFFIYLDADEVIGEESHEEIREAVKHNRSLVCHRINFWRDPQHQIPEGHCLGSKVIRVGPQKYFFPSDYPDPRAVDICAIAQPSTVTIYHYGFLRRAQAFFRKARSVQRIWANSYDPRLTEAEKLGENWNTYPGISDWLHLVLPYTGSHPKVIHQWLTERGYNVT